MARRVLTLAVQLVCFAVSSERLPCADDDAKWAARGKSCQQMRLLCDDPGNFGDLVRSSCPLSCGLCAELAATSAASSEGEFSDEVTFLKVEEEVKYTRKAEGVPKIEDSPLAGMAELAARRPQVPDANHEVGEVESRRRNVSTPVVRIDLRDVLRPSTATDWTRRRSRNETSNRTAAEEAAGRELLPAKLRILEAGPRHRSNQSLVAVISDNYSLDLLMDDELLDEAFESNATDPLADVVSLKANASRQLGVGSWLMEGAAAKLIPRVGEAASEQDEDDVLCPLGYEWVVGHVDGGDQWTGNYRPTAESIEACALRCTRTPGCGSFEYSTETRRCHRKTQTRPTKPGEERSSFVFCRRAPCPSLKTREACVGPALARDRYSEDVSLSPGSYCIWSGGACQAPMACSDQDCFLPDGGLPGMYLPPKYTLWISRESLLTTMMPITRLAR